MSTSKYIDRICAVVLIFVLVLTILFCNAQKLGVQAVQTSSMGYESRLFDTSKVHTIDIEMDDWDDFIENCEDEEYVMCSLVIDNEAFKNVAIRAKGNTSLSSVATYGNDRYSFKIEFDHYSSENTYYGLDKLCLNNIIQDNTYMKDYLTYQMMNYFGVNAPLCSYVQITVNGEDWGLYLAVEGIEESFLERNYGSSYGELYKPDTTQDNNGLQDNMEEPTDMPEGEDAPDMGTPPDRSNDTDMGTPPDRNNGTDLETPPDRNDDTDTGTPPEQGDMPVPGGGEDGHSEARTSEDVSLIYSDDSYDSYSNIFDNAKTDVSDTDKDRLIASIKQMNEQENIEEVVDVDAVIRYFVVHNFVCNFDSYTGSMIHNYYLYEDDGVMSMIPWDYNLAFGGFQSETDATALVNDPIDTPVSGGTVDSRPMLSWIFSDETYTEEYHEAFAEFIEEVCDSGYLSDLIASTEELIDSYVQNDTNGFCTYDEFKAGVSALKEFCSLRAESITGQLDGTIPSTEEGQTADDAALIDASDLTISDMGSMGSMGGGMSGGNAPSGNSSGGNMPGGNAPGGNMPDGNTRQ